MLGGGSHGATTEGGNMLLRKIRSGWLACVLLFAILGAPVACSGGAAQENEPATDETSRETDRGSTLTVLAASSLTDAFGEMAQTFEEQNPGVEVRQTFESSSTLLTQIQQGAPADVFASAAE